MKPKYFAVKRTDSPLWKKYIKWLNETYKSDWDGGSSLYYGFDGTEMGFSGTNHWNDLSKFENQPTLLTLEEWEELFIGKSLFTIQDLTDGKCAVINDGTLEELRQILYLAFPAEDDFLSSGVFRYYYKSNNKVDKWLADNVTTLPIQSVKEFLKEETMEKKIIGYKLIKPEYKSAVINITNLSRLDYDNPLTVSDGTVAHDTLKNAGVLDLWFEPVYGEKFKVGDWVVVKSYIQRKHGNNIGVDNHICQLKPKADNVNGLLYWDADWTVTNEDGTSCSISNECIIRKATPEEIEISQTKIIELSNGKKVHIKDKQLTGEAKGITKPDLEKLYSVSKLGETDWVVQFNSFDIGCYKNITREDIYNILKNL